MNGDRKQSIWPWLVALIGLPILYFLSIGPVTFVAVIAREQPEWADALYGAVYTPFWWVRDHLSPPLQEPFYDYPGWWMALAVKCHHWFKP